MVDAPADVEQVARALTERGIEAETVVRLAQFIGRLTPVKVLKKVEQTEGYATYEVAVEGTRHRVKSRAKEIYEGLTVLADLKELEIPTLEELGISPVRFPLVKPKRMPEYEFFNDGVIDFAVVSNRGDLLSHLGIAREVKVAYGKRIRECKVAEVSGGGMDVPSITLKATELCPRYVGAFLDVNKIERSPDWIIYRITLCGVNPVNNVVDLSNYVLLELGQPLHTFDRDKLTGGIIVRRAIPAERFVAINHLEYTLDDSMLVIADEKKAVAIAGVMGGLDTEVSTATRRILLESAYFTPENIRVESKRLGIASESSLRFGRGTDPEMPPLAARRFIHLAQKIGACKFLEGSFNDVNSYVRESAGIRFSFEFLRSFLGADFDARQTINSLRQLGITIKKENKQLVAFPPSWRKDLEIAEDIAEEALRVSLFDGLKAKTVNVPLRSGITEDILAFEELAEDVMTSLGAQQTINYVFVSAERARIYRFGEDELVLLQNPDTSDQYCLQPTLLPGLIQAVSRNISHLEKPQVLFEIGRIYSLKEFGFAGGYEISGPNGKYYEQHALGVILGSGLSHPGIEKDSFAPAHSFYYLKGILQAFLAKLGIQSYRLEPTSYSVFTQDKSFIVLVEDKSAGKWHSIGRIGEVNEEIAHQENIEGVFCYLELSLDSLLPFSRTAIVMEEFSPYPPAVRDIALLMPLELESQRVAETIKASCGESLKNVDPFDVYVGEQIPPGMKSVAYRLAFQRMDRTLTNEEVDELILRSLEDLKEKWGVYLRDYDKISGMKVFSDARCSEKLKAIYDTAKGRNSLES